jgi:uncharacterized membrane protein
MSYTHRRLFQRGISIILLIALLAAPIARADNSASVLQTIGDFLSLGANTVREVQEAIQLATGEGRALLEELQGRLTQLLGQISQAYQDNLNITIDSLDAATRNKLLELQTILDQVNEQLQEDIRLISDEAQETIRTASREVQTAIVTLEQSLTNVIIVGGETAAFILDVAVFNAILIISLVLLAIGLLLFVWLFFSKKFPSGLPGVLAFIFIIAYVGVFGALILVPNARTTLMTFTGVGLKQRLETVANQPRVVAVVPESILLGETDEVQVWGSGLLPNNQAPTVQIASSNVPLNASSNQQIVANVSSLSAPAGSTNLTLQYPERDPITSVVRIVVPTPVPQPPDLQITSFSISPASPVQRQNARATITIRNNGGLDARNFVLQWKPFAAHPGESTSISRLAAGASQTFNFDHSYINSGTFDSVAAVDVFNAVAESNEGNNNQTRSVNVQPAPPRQARVTVNFTQITIHDDADPFAEGELILDFNINGQTRRFPSSGTRGMNDGGTITLNQSFTFTLQENRDTLNIFVNGTDEDSPGFPTFDDHDPMGTVSRSFNSGNQWGAGSHSDRSTCPDGCYTIHYTITTTFLN